MNLQGLTIKKLFGQFDYNISFNQEEGMTILTGPNGYGKTTILNIIYNFFKQNFFFFQKLNFESIVFCFSDNKQIEVLKGPEVINYLSKGDKDILEKKRMTSPVFFNIILNVKDNEKTIENYIYTTESENELLQKLDQLYPTLPYIRPMFQKLIDTRIGYVVDDNTVIGDFLLQNEIKTLDIIDYFPKKMNEIVNLHMILSSVNVYIIREQRLLHSVTTIGNIGNKDNGLREKQTLIHAIQTYSNELISLIAEKQRDAFQESQRLDNSFPKRVMQTEKKLTKDEFNERFKKLEEKQKQLLQFGMAISNIEVPEYSQEKADVLTVYLEDSEKKTAFFDDLVKKLDVFVNILNSKAFAYKSIQIQGPVNYNGFSFFSTTTGHEIDLTDLSSGEQQEVVLLYELLFTIKENTLVLIDEPEMSLHVVWQKALVNDLMAISKVKHISFLLATHSPQIINGRWDLTTDLYEIANAKDIPEK